MSSKEHKPAVLLVDDHPNNLVALEAVLGSTDYRLITATSGKQALQILDGEDFALVLLDIQMPEMDGYEVLRRMKSSERMKHIPVILVTAIYTEDPHVRKGYEVGAVDYFAKPFNPDLLRMKVGIYTNLYAHNLLLRRNEDERRQMELKLRSLEDRRSAELRTLLESIPDAVYVGDEKGITRCNTAAISMFGFGSREDLNQHYEGLARRIEMRYVDTGGPIPPEDLPFAHALRGEQFVGELRIRHFASGEDLNIACAASPIQLEGQIIGAVVVNVPVNDLPDPYQNPFRAGRTPLPRRPH